MSYAIDPQIADTVELVSRILGAAALPALQHTQSIKLLTVRLYASNDLATQQRVVGFDLRIAVPIDVSNITIECVTLIPALHAFVIRSPDKIAAAHWRGATPKVLANCVIRRLVRRRFSRCRR